MTTKEMSDFINSLWCWARCTEEEQRKLSEIADYLSNRGNEKNDLAVDVPDNNVGKIDRLSVTPIRPKGHWISHREHCENLGVMPSGLGAYEWCSNCDCGIDVREWHRNHYNYCPNCGAKMVEPQAESENP